MNKKLQSSHRLLAILNFPAQNRNENKLSADDMTVEEGFKIIRKMSTPIIPQVKDNSAPEATKELPKNVKKIFGDDEE